MIAEDRRPAAIEARIRSEDRGRFAADRLLADRYLEEK